MIRKCKVKTHQNNPIAYICFQDQCASRRVCCSSCMDNHSRNHINWALLNPPYQFLIKKIAKHKNCSKGEYIRAFIEIITQKRKKMITKLKEFTKKQQQKLQQLSNFVVGMLLGDNIEKQLNNIRLQTQDKQIQDFVRKVNLCDDPHISTQENLLQALRKISQGNFGEEQHLIDNIYDSLNKIQQSFESSSLFNETTNWKQMVQSYYQPYQPRKQLDLLIQDMKQEGWEKLNSLVNTSGKEIFKIKQLSLPRQRLRKIIKLNSFENLEDLNLGFNCIKKIQNIGLRNLIKLNLESNSIQKLQNLYSFINLQELNLDSNKIAIIENIENLQKLRQLYLCNNKINKIQNLALQNLQILHLGGNLITTIENLNNLISLTSLRLNNNLIKNYNRLPEVSKINDIALYENPQFSQAFKEQMRRLSTRGIRILWDCEN